MDEEQARLIQESVLGTSGRGGPGSKIELAPKAGGFPAGWAVADKTPPGAVLAPWFGHEGI
jgi:hypothetical protein